MTSTSPSPVPALVLRRLAAVLGWLSLFAALALLSPGVLATAQAEEAGVAGPSCQAGSDPTGEQISVALAQMIERMRAEAETQDGSEDGVVVLNNRGYNYAPGRVPEPAMLESERQNR